MQGIELHPDPATLKRRSVHGALVTTASQVVKCVLQLGSLIALSRLLAPVEFGLVAMVMPVVAFVQLFSEFGLSHAIVQRSTITHAHLSSIFWVNLCISLGLASALAMAAPLVGWFYGEPQTVLISAAFAPMLVLSSLSAQPIALLSRQMRFTTMALIDVAAATAATFAGIGSALLGAGYWSLVAMQAAHFCTLLVLAWALSGWRPSRPRWEPGVGALLRFGGNLTATNLVYYFSSNLDKVLIGAVAGTFQLGLYDRAAKMLNAPIWQVVTPAARVAVPLLSRLQDSPDRYRRAYRQITAIMLLATSPAIVCAGVLAETVVVVLIGDRWLPAAPLLAWMALGTLLVPANLSIGWLFLSQGRTKELLVWGSVTSAIMVASYFVGLPWGVKGVAAAGALFVWLFCTPLLWWAVTRRGPVRLPDLLEAILPGLAASAASAAVLCLLRVHLGSGGIASLGVAVAVSYATSFFVLACLPFGNRQLREAWGALSTLSPRTGSDEGVGAPGR